MKLKLVLTFLPFLFIAYGKSIDPSQASWHKKYVKQQNAPDPADMLLNTDPEPNLKKGFVDLFNGKDLKGWTPRGGTCKFEVEDGAIAAPVYPARPARTFPPSGSMKTLFSPAI